MARRKKSVDNPPVETPEIITYVALESFGFECDGVMKQIKYQQEFTSREVPERVLLVVKHKKKE